MFVGKESRKAVTMADVQVQPSLLQPPTEKRVLRIRSPSPGGLRGRSQTPIRGGRSMTPLMRFREKSATPSDQPSVWRSITPFIQREEKEKTPLEIGQNIILNLASYKAIIDKALVMDISLDEESPVNFILSEHSVIDRAAIMDLSNVEIIYVEDDEFDSESDFRESETPETSVPPEEKKEKDELTGGSDDEAAGEKKKKKAKPKKVVKKKEKKEKEDTPPKLKLDLGPPAPKVSKSKLFEQKAEPAPAAKPPPKRTKLAGPLAALQEQEAKAKEEAERLAREEEERRQQEEEELQRQQEEAEAEEKEGSDAEHESGDEHREGSEEGGSERGSRSGSGSGSGGSGSEGGSGGESEGEDGEGGEEEQSEGDENGYYSSEDDFTRPNPDEEGLWSKLEDGQQGVIRSGYERKKHKKLSERERDVEWQKRREAARIPRIHVHLKDITTSEGHNVRLTCNVSGPELIIRWLKNGEPIEKGPKYRILANEGIVALEIVRSVADDSGEYTCSIRNNNGDAVTSAIITIYEIIKDEPAPPTFTLARGKCSYKLLKSATAFGLIYL